MINEGTKSLSMTSLLATMDISYAFSVKEKK
jgi:hypothetical protein